MDWPQINDLYKARCPNVLDLMDLILSMPTGEAECERGFTQLTVTKDEYRNRYKVLAVFFSIAF